MMERGWRPFGPQCPYLPQVNSRQPNDTILTEQVLSRRQLLGAQLRPWEARDPLTFYA